MYYPKNKTQFIKFLEENPDIHFKVTFSSGMSQMRKLCCLQTNGFTSLTTEGHKTVFYFESEDEYTFEGSVFKVTCPGCNNLIYDFNPTQDEIDAFEKQRKGAAV